MSIFIDGKFAFGATLETIAKNNLKVGTYLAENQIAKIVSTDKSVRLMDLALRFLSFRPRSVKEVESYLAAKIAKSEQIKFRQAQESRQIPIIIQKLKRYQYLNDRQFAKWYLESRAKSNPRGLSYLKMELKAKGISNELIGNLLAGFSEVEMAKKAVEKKLKTWQRLPKIDFKKKFYSFLLTRGFSYETIRELFANLVKNI